MQSDLCVLQAEAVERVQKTENMRRRRAADAAMRRQRQSSDGGQRVEVWISANGSSQSQTQNGSDDDDDADDLSSLPLVEVTVGRVSFVRQLVAFFVK